MKNTIKPCIGFGVWLGLVSPQTVALPQAILGSDAQESWVWVLSQPRKDPKIRMVPVPPEERLLIWGTLEDGGWGLLESGVLFTWDSGGHRRGHLCLPIEGVRANGRAVRVSDRWLICCVVEDLNHKSHLWIIEKQSDRLQCVVHRGLTDFLCSTTQPIVIKRSITEEMVFCGVSSQKATVRLISLERPYKEESVSASGGAFTEIEAIDMWGQNMSDRLYAFNNQGVWLLDFLQTGRPQFQLRSRSQGQGRCRIVHHATKSVLRLFYIGYVKGQKGLVTLEDPIEKTFQMMEPKLMTPGDWLGFELRLGALLLIPKQLLTKLALVDFEGRQIAQFQMPLEGTLDFFVKIPSAVRTHDQYYFMNLSGQLILFNFPDFSREVKSFYLNNR